MPADSKYRSIWYCSTRAMSPWPRPVADLVNGKDAIDHSRDGAHSDERVHVGAAVEQGAEAVFVVLVVDIQDRQGEQELGKGEGYGVLVTH